MAVNEAEGRFTVNTPPDATASEVGRAELPEYNQTRVLNDAVIFYILTPFPTI